VGCKKNNNSSNNNSNNNNKNKNKDNKDNKNNNNSNNKKKKKNICDKMVASCGMERTSQCALQLRARAEHMNNTNAHTTIHNPYRIAGVRSSTIYICTLYTVHI
jgi:aspartate oxidase